MLRINPPYENPKAVAFCEAFLHSARPKYIFGRNIWAESISKSVEIDGFIDDFTTERSYLGKPIVPIEAVPDDALVVVVVIGKPLLAEKRVRKFQFDSLDYFSFFKYSGLPLEPIMFWEGMKEDIDLHRNRYEWIYGMLADQTSRNQMYHILNFRYSYDLDYMRGFENKEDRQYFEDFLGLERANEVFVDIGAYDGYTSEEFIKRSPSYRKVFLFEPEAGNMRKAEERLKSYANIHYFQTGLSDRKEILRFDISGSSSKISENGSVQIPVDRLDDLVDEEVTFIKMDIEGAEREAIEGAKSLIRRYHPKLAISVYHRKDDFWKIPEQILEIRDDYRIYLRHYTEGISETIMFFIPECR